MKRLIASSPNPAMQSSDIGKSHQPLGCRQLKRLEKRKEALCTITASCAPDGLSLVICKRLTKLRGPALIVTR
jgi:hypothetical protein